MNQFKEDLFQICIIVAEQEDLHVTLKESFNGGLFTALGAFIGALLYGTTGLAIGGSLFAIIAGYHRRNKFKSVGAILKRGLTPQKKEILMQEVFSRPEPLNRIFNNPEEYDELLYSFVINTNLKTQVVRIIKQFFKKELNMDVESNF